MADHQSTTHPQRGNDHVSLTLSLLGSFQATINGHPVTGFRSDKVRALLAYLAIEADRPHRREALAALFWPDHTEEGAHLNLRQSLLRLRRALAGGDTQTEFLLISRTDVQFDRTGGHQVDAAVVDRLLSACEVHAHSDPIFCPDCVTRRRQATSLYRGSLLTGLTVRDSDAFDEWLVARQEQFHRQILQALDALADYHEQNGEYELARQYAQRQIALEPWNEAAHRQLMRGFALSGQRAAALAQYENCRRILERELGAEPEAESRALCEQIRAGGMPVRSQGDGLAPVAPARWAVPVPLTPFIGRAQELAELEKHLHAPDDRLLTLMGPGGVGKSRLALRVAELHQEAFEHGAALIPLAPVYSPDLLVAAIAGALGISFHGQERPKQQLLNLLREREALLVMDNFEQLVERADLLGEILSHAPGVRLLVTSQVRLNLPGERVIELGGFALPGVDPHGEGNDGVALFLSRAQQATPAFAATPLERDAIAEICRLVAGVPLAIEMAASWTRTLTVTEVARELATGNAMLKRAPGGRATPALQPIFDRSWRLLSPSEKYVFRKISVFPGSFDREAAAKVAGATVENLTRLLDSSFLLRPAPGRYEAHESLKQYGAARLAEVPQEVTDTRDRQSDYYVAYLRGRLGALRGSEQRVALRELNDEIENIRHAWGWALSEGRLDAIEQALEPLFHLYDIRSWFEEGARAFGSAVAVVERQAGGDARPTPASGAPLVLLGKLLARKGWFSFHLGDHRQAVELLERSISLLRESEAWAAIVFSLNYLAAVTYRLGDYGTARELCHESLDHCERGEDRHGAAIASNILSQIAFPLGEYEEAERYGRAALAIEREIGNRWSMAYSLTNLGNVAFATGAYAEARERYEESLEIRQDVQDARGMALANISLGLVARATGSPGTAERHFLEALRTARAIQSLPVALNALSRYAELLREKGDAQAERFALAVVEHPASSKESRDRAAALLSGLPGSVGAAGEQRQSLNDLIDALFSGPDDGTASGVVG